MLKTPTLQYQTKLLNFSVFSHSTSVIFMSSFSICPFSCASPALQVVFGSLYRDDVLIKPSRVVSILAAACMLQLVSTEAGPIRPMHSDRDCLLFFFLIWTANKHCEACVLTSEWLVLNINTMYFAVMMYCAPLKKACCIMCSVLKRSSGQYIWALALEQGRVLV